MEEAKRILSNREHRRLLKKMALASSGLESALEAIEQTELKIVKSKATESSHPAATLPISERVGEVETDNVFIRMTKKTSESSAGEEDEGSLIVDREAVIVLKKDTLLKGPLVLIVSTTNPDKILLIQTIRAKGWANFDYVVRLYQEGELLKRDAIAHAERFSIKAGDRADNLYKLGQQVIGLVDEKLVSEERLTEQGKITV